MTRQPPRALIRNQRRIIMRNLMLGLSLSVAFISTFALFET